MFTPEGKSSRKPSSPKNTLGPAGMGHRVLEGCAAEIHLHGGRPEREVYSSIASRGVLTSFGDAAASRVSSRHAQHPVDSKGNIYTTETYEGKPSTVHVQGPGARPERKSGRRLAEIQPN